MIVKFVYKGKLNDVRIILIATDDEGRVTERDLGPASHPGEQSLEDLLTKAFMAGLETAIIKGVS